MRYENWDILLFPEGSKIPIQEFKTQCFVTKDIESPYLLNSPFGGPSSYYPIQGNFGQLPVLTTFIPSLAKDAPFRVSIHSWEKPRPSRLMESLMQPDDTVLFEARVFIDGVLAAGGIFGQRSSWPYVIDFSSHIDRDGNQDSLRFPDFHPEILEQRHWDAGDLFGRIKVVIAEGFARPHRSPPFERVKDAIALSFQHAPIQILEFSNIAWPNPGMWSQVYPTGFKYNQSGGVGSNSEPADVHGHSPSKADTRLLPNSSVHSGPSPAIYNAFAPNRAFPVSQWQMQPRDHRWAAFQERYQEPFMSGPAIETFANNATWNQHRGARSSREDIPMPDYSSSSSSRAISSMTGISYEHSKPPSVTAPMEEDQYNLLLQALTPTKAPTIGTRAPSNTPSAIAVTICATNTSAVVGRNSTKDKQSNARGSALREISQPSTRQISGSSLQSASKETTPSKLGTSSSSNIKGRKEGIKEAQPQTPTKNNGQNKIILGGTRVEELEENELENVQAAEATEKVDREDETL